MGSVGRTVVEEGSLCCLPTSGHEPASNPGWQHIAVRIHKEFSYIHTGKTLLDRTAIVQSWAVLLRCYIGTELVFFAEFYDSHTVEANNKPAGPDAGNVGDSIRILQYQLLDNLELQHISEDGSHIHGEASTERRVANTAVHISRESCICCDASNGQILSKPPVKLTNLDHVGGLFSVLTVSDSKRSFSLALLFLHSC